MARTKLACVPTQAFSSTDTGGWFGFGCYATQNIVVSCCSLVEKKTHSFSDITFSIFYLHMYLLDIIGRSSIPIILGRVCECLREYICIWIWCTHVCCVCICAGWCLEPRRGCRMSWCHVEIRGQVINVDYLLPLCGFLESNAGTQSWSLIAEQFCWSMYAVYRVSN